ncbi:hypothetical protein Lalb_Chr05g0221031 [Lupinus albus]|uniref:Uncharacterized protein n=1 Tax=Lupinus albus TaxID=3870 RepID=A0A6A4QHZ0_LUPAL|nr:hypothetical protein Lalb_Chr05g0221031 [Lupinus albus]
MLLTCVLTTMFFRVLCRVLNISRPNLGIFYVLKEYVLICLPTVFATRSRVLRSVCELDFGGGGREGKDFKVMKYTCEMTLKSFNSFYSPPKSNSQMEPKSLKSLKLVINS